MTIRKRTALFGDEDRDSRGVGDDDDHSHGRNKLVYAKGHALSFLGVHAACELGDHLLVIEIEGEIDERRS